MGSGASGHANAGWNRDECPIFEKRSCLCGGAAPGSDPTGADQRGPESPPLSALLKPCARAQEQKAAVLNAARDRAQRHIVDDEDERSRPAPFAKLCGSFAGMPG